MHNPCIKYTTFLYTGKMSLSSTMSFSRYDNATTLLYQHRLTSHEYQKDLSSVCCHPLVGRQCDDGLHLCAVLGVSTKNTVYASKLCIYLIKNRLDRARSEPLMFPILLSPYMPTIQTLLICLPAGCFRSRAKNILKFSFLS